MTAVEPDATPAALLEPTTPVRRSWIGLLFAANLGLWMVFFTPVQVLLAQQIEDIHPTGKEAMLGLVTGLGALVAIVVNPLAGALSDRTTLRLRGRDYGRRHVWTVGGLVVAGGSCLFLSVQDTVPGVVLGWVGTAAGLNAMLASLTAAVPDRVPVLQRGGVSGWIGIPQSLGLVLGAALTTAVVTGVGSGWLVMALCLVVLALPFALLTPDDPLPRGHHPRLTARALLGGLKVDLRANPDFAWAWGTRFLVQLGNALGTLYLLYFLTDEVQVADPETGLLVMILLYTMGMVATAVVAGRLSDRSGRRKPYVLWSGAAIAAAAFTLAIWPVWPAALVASVLLGGGYGIYLAVDAALITQVLPAATDRAKDLGIINIANAAPQALGPAISAPIVVYLGGYSTLYAVTAVVTLLGSTLVVKIRSVD
ncbi:MFS transporter [Spirilliplanes yamanashiensis]|uniref:MFS transporter n=1 Tax=Spirilliplanes yamanashiensis TaxID=42233 RepID=A0A8J3YCI7_9ACTN|nr:MFS transporter [Spirilliplanes yamanashiensis]MDP9816647.1 MFS family permease [Spirilliplanes yamanashiensis]GIJ06171.1 MFS transporter [Spirilliplanes yamanashiensis]